MFLSQQSLATFEHICSKHENMKLRVLLISKLNKNTSYMNYGNVFRCIVSEFMGITNSFPFRRSLRLYFKKRSRQFGITQSVLTKTFSAQDGTSFPMLTRVLEVSKQMPCFYKREPGNESKTA